MTFVEVNPARKESLRHSLLVARSVPLNRTNSTLESPAFEQAILTHRRTQSDTQTMKSSTEEVDNVVLRRTGSSLRRNRNSDMTKTREYYGAESYTVNDLIQRRHTVLRAKEYVSLIE